MKRVAIGTPAQKCCACGGDGRRYPRERYEFMRGLLELTPGKWICAMCARVATSGWAARSRGLRIASTSG